MMNISHKKLLIIRFFINPISIKTPNPNSSLISSPPPSSSSPINTPIHNTNHTYSPHRCFSAVSNTNNRLIPNQNTGFVTKKKPTNTLIKPYVSPNLISKVIDVVKNSNGCCRSELNSMDLCLTKSSICEIFRVLSFEKVPALQFFEWVRGNNPDCYRNGDVCSLMIDNCGWLNDYNTMKGLLKMFKHEGICLNEKAFGFLPVLDSTKARAMECVEMVVKVLSEVGGSVRGSGVFSLISMLCDTDSFELARYVIEVTEKKPSYYAVLVRGLCRRRRTDEAYDLIKKMRVEDCEPECKLYNYVLGSLYKMDKVSEALSVGEEMIQAGVDPDEITFEILILVVCKHGWMESAKEFYDRLVQSGRRPRFSTYAAIVKGYFNAERYDEAYAFVRGIEAKKMPASNKMFSLLAWLHKQDGNLDAAGKILDEMMEKGLKPDFLHYAKTVSAVRRFEGKDLDRDFAKFSKFRVE